MLIAVTAAMLLRADLSVVAVNLCQKKSHVRSMTFGGSSMTV